MNIKKNVCLHFTSYHQLLKRYCTIAYSCGSISLHPFIEKKWKLYFNIDQDRIFLMNIKKYVEIIGNLFISSRD